MKGRGLGEDFYCLCSLCYTDATTRILMVREVK